MLRSSLFTASAFALVASAAAQTTPFTSDSAVKVTVPVKNGGTYHVATGTWTRANSAVANFGINDNIYSNTAASGYYTAGIGPLGAAALGQILDSGNVPGTTNTGTFANGALITSDFNTVTEVQIGYCDFDVNSGVAGWTLDFYESYNPCTFPPTGAVGNVTVTGLPSNGCWVIDIDLSNATGTGDEFQLQADGGALFPGFDNDPTLDSIGMGWTYAGTGVGNAGPLITGDPQLTDTGWLGGVPSSGSNTYYGEPGGCPGTGSGQGTLDNFWFEDTFAVGGLPAGSGCYFFGGYNNNGSPCGGAINASYAGFHMEISSGGGGVVPPISSAGCVGAVTATGSASICEVYGDATAANNDAELRASGLPVNQFGIFATGLAAIAPNTVLSGNGWICINPTALGGLGRFQNASQIKNSGAGGTFSLDSASGEWDLSMIPTSQGMYSAMTGTTSNFQAWFREPVGAGWNFTGSCEVTWL